MKERIRHVISVSGGKDSTATLLLALNRVPRERLIAIFCDTGHENAITYQYLDDLSRHLGIGIIRLKADFTAEILAKRQFIAGDQRTRRKYRTMPVYDPHGNPIPKRDGRGNILYHKVNKDGHMVIEAVQKTRKVGGGQPVRWSNKAKRRALEHLHPSGNPFLDLCMWKGRFPSRKTQFCTEELKRNIAVSFQLGLMDAGYLVISWQGIRRDESPNRCNAKKMERIGPKFWTFRPLVDWTAQQTIDFVVRRDCPLNPLYRQGASRVGCFPCINVNKRELAQISLRFPEEMDRVEKWEWLVGQCSKRGYSTLKCDAHSAVDRRQIFQDLNIRARVAWATGSDNHSLSLFEENYLRDMLPACSSSYGLCE